MGHALLKQNSSLIGSIFLIYSIYNFYYVNNHIVNKKRFKLNLCREQHKLRINKYFFERNDSHVITLVSSVDVMLSITLRDMIRLES